MISHGSSGGQFIAKAVGKIFYLVKDRDMLPFLIDENADIGFMGSDAYTEIEYTAEGLQTRFEPLGIKIGEMILAAKSGQAARYKKLLNDKQSLVSPMVATKYPVGLARFARERRYDISIKEMISVEAAVIGGECELMFDIRESGQTLKDNKLVIVARAGRVELGGICKDMNAWRMPFDEFKDCFGYNGGET